MNSSSVSSSVAADTVVSSGFWLVLLAIVKLVTKIYDRYTGRVHTVRVGSSGRREETRTGSADPATTTERDLHRTGADVGGRLRHRELRGSELPEYSAGRAEALSASGNRASGSPSPDPNQERITASSPSP